MNQKQTIGALKTPKNLNKLTIHLFEVNLKHNYYVG